MQQDTALLVIDVQLGFFESDPPVYRAADLLGNIRSLINKARHSQVPIIFIEHVSDPEIDGPIHPQIAPNSRDIVVSKQTPDAFHETHLQQILDRRGIRNVIIAGLQTEFCINATCRRAHELGYNVILISDAHSTYDAPSQTALEIITAHNGALAQIVTLRPAHAIKFPRVAKAS